MKWSRSAGVLLFCFAAATCVAQDRELEYVGDYIPAQEGGLGFAVTGSDNPYASLHISGVPGTLTQVSVALEFLGLPVEDADIVLQAPDGQAIVLMSDAGGGAAPESFPGYSFLFLDSAPENMPNDYPPNNGFYRPTNYDLTDFLPAPGPSGPYAGALSSLNGSSPNGEWRLYVYDDNDASQFCINNVTWGLKIVTTESNSVQPPANDNFANAFQLSGRAGETSVTMMGAFPTLEPGEPDLCVGYYLDDTCDEPGQGSVWYRWAAPFTGILKVFASPCTVAIYSGESLGELVLLNETDSGLPFVNVQQGASYYFRVDSAQPVDDFAYPVHIYWTLERGSQLASSQSVRVDITSGFAQVISYDFDLGVLEASNTLIYSNTTSYELGTGWMGLYLFDYNTQMFTEAFYDKRLDLLGDSSSNVRSGLATSLPEVALETVAPGSTFSPTQLVILNSNPDIGYQELIYNFATGALQVSPYMDAYFLHAFEYDMPADQWIGVYHYCYLSGQFTEGLIRLKPSI